MTSLSRIMAVAMLFSVWFFQPGAAAEPARRPNIILILADDLGYGSLGCFGQQRIQTPHLDQLARDGVRFTQFYAGCHLCQPSRSVLMTGRHTGHTACRANDVNQHLLAEDVTIAEVLKGAGYRTALFGKWGLGNIDNAGHPQRQGFDRYFGPLLQVHAHFQYPAWLWDDQRRREFPENHGRQRGTYVLDELHRQSLAWIDQPGADPQQPFFLTLCHIVPHVELVAPPDSEQPYLGKFPRRSILDGRPGYFGSDDGLTTLAAMISRLDASVGQLVEHLQRRGLDRDTLILFTSDNGGQNGGYEQGWTAMTDYFQANGPLRGYKGSWYEGGIRVPMIVRYPAGCPGGRSVDTIAGFQDVLPTFAAAAKATLTASVDGQSLWPTITNTTTQPGHEFMYWEHPGPRGQGLSRAGRLGPWKLIQNRENGPIELYHLDRDLAETTNLADQHPDIVTSIQQRFAASHTPPRSYPASGTREALDVFVK